MKFLILGGAGALGTISRYLLGGWVHGWLGTHFPYGTLTVNITGCFVIGFLGTLADERNVLSPELRMAIFLGFLGAFTTFSSFSYESWQLLKDGQLLQATYNVLGTFIACFTSLLVGIVLARLL